MWARAVLVRAFSRTHASSREGVLPPGLASRPEAPAHTQSAGTRLAARRGPTLLDKDPFFPPWSGGAEGAQWMHKHGQEGRPPESFQKPLSDK